METVVKRAHNGHSADTEQQRSRYDALCKGGSVIFADQFFAAEVAEVVQTLFDVDQFP